MSWECLKCGYNHQRSKRPVRCDLCGNRALALKKNWERMPIKKAV